ncbi:MAG: NlpC/P60 family protein [Pseudonocardiales bacterium]|nr:NlpC/P60 family protein [Pseudonocardiales bacterium]
MRRVGVPRGVVVLAVLAGLLAGTSPALAQPTPPPNPSDDELRRSQEAVQQQAGEVGRLTGRLAELDAQAEELAIVLVGERENAEAAYVDLENAEAAAADAADAAADARVQTDAASRAIDEARLRLDEFVAATYVDGLDAGPLGLLTSAETPEDLVARAEFTDLLAREQLAAQDALERARVERANADSTARALLQAAEDREAEAARAKEAADAAYAVAEAAAREQAELLAAVDAERRQVEGRLAELEASDAGLRDQRARYDEWQRVLAEQEAARQRAEREAAAAREAAASAGSGGGSAPAIAAGSGAVRRVIDRAMSQIGVQYVWGGGNGRGPSTGIPGPAGDPGDRVGFDCSGLMLYAFNGVGVSLPRVSRNQYNAGRKVPISELQPGDMVFYRNGGRPIHHVAMYIGDGRMIEAPYTGADVRVVPLRRKGLLPQATRML